MRIDDRGGDVQYLRLAKRYQAWVDLARSTSPVDEATTKEAINRLYQSQGLQSPLIVFGQSPHQLQLMAALTQVFLTDIWLWQHKNELQGLLMSGPLKSACVKLLSQIQKDHFDTLCNVAVHCNSYEPEAVPRFTLVRLYVNAETHRLSTITSESISGIEDQELRKSVEIHRLQASASNVGTQFQFDLASLDLLTIFDDVSSYLETIVPATTMIENIRCNLLEPGLLFREPDLIWYGAWSPVSCPMSHFLSDYGGAPLGEVMTRTQLLSDLARAAFSFIFYREVCFAGNRPLSLFLDSSHKLHNERGPAVVFRDGYSLYSWHGVTVNQTVIDRPEEITVEMINNESNAEIRRVMVERYGGWSRFIHDSCAEVVSQDTFGTLYRINTGDAEPIMIVRVTNRTTGLDGSVSEYFLRVPPTLTSAQEAVAWTFGMTRDEYNPVAET